jgi:hypothetical protein
MMGEPKSVKGRGSPLGPEGAMETVYRVCPECGKNAPIEAQYCPHCGTDTSSGLPVRQASNLPVVVGKAALPVLATVGTLLVRTLWKMLRQRPGVFGAVIRPDATSAISPTQQPPTRNPRGPSVRIRTSWAVGDASGIRQQGFTEHEIHFDE